MAVAKAPSNSGANAPEGVINRAETATCASAGANQPLVEPSDRPLMNWRCRTRNTRIVGIAARRAPAASRFVFVKNWP